MTEVEKILRLKEIVEGDDSDSTFLSYLYQAGSVILNRMYPYLADGAASVQDVPDRYAWKQIRIAAYLMNKRGAEGEIQHIENGAHHTYRSADVPAEMLQDILPMVGIPR